MRRSIKILAACLGLLSVGVGAAVYVATPVIHAGHTGEAPELGRRGSYLIGTQVIAVTTADRPEITSASLLTGLTSLAARKLDLRIWYPAMPDAKGAAMRYDHVMLLGGKPSLTVSGDGFAITDAPPSKDGTFPLVVMSHGFGGWNTHFSKLAEHVASHGYVVVSINHADMPVDSVPSFFLSFSQVLLNRTLDQRDVIDQLVASAQRGDGIAALINPDRVGLVGYSMGGYGALASAGAHYRTNDGPVSKLPGRAKDALQASASDGAPIRALALFAPWGGQPDGRAWDAANLAAMKIPTLMVAGSEDDVVNYRDGVRWLFDNLTGADRHLLVFREARHNIIGNSFALGPDEDFRAYEFLVEPVWRSDRLNAINQHILTAFLDLHLKGKTEMAAYLDMPTKDSNAASWPTTFGEQLNGEWAGPKENGYWRGFQRRWATGMTAVHAGPGEHAPVDGAAH